MSALIAEQAQFLVVPAESAILVEARSSVGPITFGTMTVSGRIDTALLGGTVDTQRPTAATLVVPVGSLSSGNSLYDAELRSRLDARRYPEITAKLRTITPLSPGRFRVTGDLTIQSTTRELFGGLELSLSEAGTALVTGSQMIDIRDFAIDLPTMLMLRIYPDVNVRFHIKAVRASQEQETGEQI
jgi:polyisoprenoid-binding protein YceI